MTEETQAPKASSRLSTFNYCFWAKLLVAIPTLPIIVSITTAFVENSVAKTAIAALTVFILVYSAIKIDEIPMFAKKITKGRCKE